MAKQYNELTFTDDFMFCKVLLNNPEITRQLVEMILDTRINRIVRIESQHNIEDSVDSKGIRLDVCFEDDEYNVYDIEMQTYSGGDLIMRNRYYHSLIAVDNLNKGASYNELKHSYVIFICTFDPFGMNLPVYTERARFDENAEFVIDDGAVSVYLNCSSKSDKISQEMQKFFKYVRENSPSEGLTASIESDILKAKNQKNWRREYMTLFEHEEIARAEGKEEKAVEVVPKFVKLGLSVEAACENAGISVDRYKELNSAK